MRKNGIIALENDEETGYNNIVRGHLKVRKTKKFKKIKFS